METDKFRIFEIPANFCEIVEYLRINAKFTKISNKCEIAQFLRKIWKKYEIYYCPYEFSKIFLLENGKLALIND